MDPAHETLTSRDGTRLHLAVWAPESYERTVILTHGLAEHMGRYQHVAAALNTAGYRVLGLELRGHGDSEGKRGHVEAWSDYGDDLAAAVAFAGGPCFLLAHSMGGPVVLDRLQAPLPQKILGVVLTNPLLGVRVEAPKIKLWAAGLLSRLLPRISLSNELDPQMISRDPAVVKAYTEDPRVYSTITPRWYTEMRAACARILAAGSVGGVPLLMVTSDADRICDPEASRRFASACGAEQLTYPPLFHEVLNEPEQAQVIADILAWLATH
ncbi:MAG: lysophospholipase [Pseudomonadota bacterium]